MPRQRLRRLFIGATTRFINTSSSRAGPSSAVSHLSSDLIASLCSSRKRAAGGNIDGDSLDWRFLFAVNDCVSTLRFAFHRKSRWKRLTKLARNIEKLCGSSAFELKLDLAQPL